MSEPAPPPTRKPKPPEPDEPALLKNFLKGIGLPALLALHACGGAATAPPAAQGGASPAPPPPQTASVPEPPLFVPRPADLIDQSRERVAEWLGRPNFVRRDPPAEFWRYRHGACDLELYFYETAGALRLDHFERRLGDKSGATDGDCLRVLARRAARR